MLPLVIQGDIMQAPSELPLLERTIFLLRNAPRSLKAKHISTATGLSESWLSRFGHGLIARPGVEQVQTLHDYLQGIDAK